MKKGIDVSYANGRLDWKKLKSAGIEFAVIRSSFGSDDPDQVDSQFRNNAQGCIENGIPFMTYHFAYFIDEQRARDEADFAVRLAKEYPQVRAIALDLEDDTLRFSSLMGASPNWTECAAVFLERVAQAGYTPVLYTNYSFMNYVFDYDKLKKYPLWLASPGASESTALQYGSLFMWQYSWEGRPSGSNGDTDMDYCYDMDIITGKNGTSTGSGTQTGTDDSEKADYRVRVTSTDGVNIRKGAGLNYDIIGAVPFGEVVRITRRTSGGGYTWGLTDYCGTAGWIALNYTETVSDDSSKGEISQINSSQKVDYQVRVTSTDGLNIRSGAALSYGIIGAVPFGEVVRITRRTSGGGYTWGLTDYCGTTGWIALDYTEKLS